MPYLSVTLEKQTTIRKCFQLIRKFRHIVGEHHPVVWNTPSWPDCIRYAYQESGEALSAYMKMNRNHNRNHHLSQDAAKDEYVKELTQTFIMVLSIFGIHDVRNQEKESNNYKNFPIYGTLIDNICTNIGSIYNEYISTTGLNSVAAYFVLLMIMDELSEYDIYYLVIAEMERIRMTKIVHNEKITAEQKDEKNRLLVEKLDFINLVSQLNEDLPIGLFLIK